MSTAERAVDAALFRSDSFICSDECGVAEVGLRNLRVELFSRRFVLIKSSIVILSTNSSIFNIVYHANYSF